MIYWIFGQTGAGKSTLARRLAAERPAIRLDGDDMRGVWTDLDLSEASRIEQNMRVARLAIVLDRQGFDIIISTICPYRSLRWNIGQLLKGANVEGRWIYLPGGHATDVDHPFEPPD